MDTQTNAEQSKKSLFGRLLESTTSFLILGIIGGIGFVGHETHWDFAKMKKFLSGDFSHGHVHHDHPKGEESADAPPPPSADSSYRRRQVKFRSKEALRKTGIQTAVVEERDIEQRVNANGTVGYDQTHIAQLSTRVPGVVWRVEKMVGDKVKKGDVLAIIESVEIGKAKTEFLTAIADVDIKSKLLEMASSLEGVVPVRQVREAEAAVREARIRLFNAHQALVNLGLPVDVAQASKLPDDKLNGFIQFIGLPESLAKTLDPSKTTANLIPLVAPFDAVVIGRDVVLGEVVSPEKSQFTVADVSRMWIHLNLRQEDAAKVHLAQEVKYKPDGLNKEIVSTIAWISTEADSKTRTIEVRADWREDNKFEGSTNPTPKNRLLHANSFGVGRITIAKRKGLVVPKRAVQFEAGIPVVFVKVNDSAFEERAVQIGLEDEETFELIGGVKPGDSVATIGSNLIKSELSRRQFLESMGKADVPATGTPN